MKNKVVIQPSTNESKGFASARTTIQTRTTVDFKRETKILLHFIQGSVSLCQKEELKLCLQQTTKAPTELCSTVG